MEKGMITANAECSVYKNDMHLIKKDSSDGYVWESRKKGVNAHRSKRSVRKNSWFEESNLMLTNMWVRKSNRDFISLELNVSKKTVKVFAQSWIGEL
ncbi:uncharacterized protein TNCV_1175651 [Trichonephila clavipes]|nr:uncharacterized protein TNCV_1175651 [Trichonephila clavipes]